MATLGDLQMIINNGTNYDLIILTHLDNYTKDDYELLLHQIDLIGSKLIIYVEHTQNAEPNKITQKKSESLMQIIQTIKTGSPIIPSRRDINTQSSRLFTKFTKPGPEL